MNLSFPQGLLSLSELLDGVTQVAPDQDRPILDLCLDSRRAIPGSLFCALAGSRAHGMEFAGRAKEQGAVALLAEPSGTWDEPRLRECRERLGLPVLAVPRLGSRLSGLAGRFFGNPSQGLDLIGVTGTNGKTSVSQFAAQALDPECPCGIVGTLGYGFPGRLTETGYTTPDAVGLQAMLADLKARGARAVAMEISSHALDQGRAAGVKLDSAIFTNLTRDHLDYHGDMASYGRAKARLFQLPGLRHGICNADDPFGLTLLASLPPGVEPILYGLTPAVRQVRPEVRWLRAEVIETLPRGIRARVAGSWGEGELTSGLLGQFNLGNLLAVLAVLLTRGWELAPALARLGQVQGVSGRMECFGTSGQPLVVVDYAHTPDALEQALGVLRAHAPGRLICLFGCGGDRDRGKRPMMGASAERLSDLVILTDDNPRREDGSQIVADILAGVARPNQVLVERDRATAIQRAIELAEPGDTLLVAGKGHETTQTTGTQVLPFRDQDQVVKALATWTGASS